jgi:3-hydroxybutyryl-CoA dehydratase
MGQIAERKYAEIEVGQKGTYSKTITEQDINAFAEITGDSNPVHTNEEYARGSFFKERIAHGFLTGSLISTVLGNILPGPGTIYLSQEMKFLAPVKIGDTITAECEVVEKKDLKNILKFSTNVRNQAGQLVLEGQATVMKPD